MSMAPAEEERVRPDHSMLEDQMCCYTGSPSDDSPDVLDAMVYAVTELILENRRSRIATVGA